MKEDIERKKYLSLVQDIIHYYRECDKICSLSSCNEKAILSHVFQNNRILNAISDSTGSLMEFRFNSIFQGAFPQYKTIHKNNVLTYHGFCQSHDNKIFSEIEPQNNNVNWSLVLSQYLLAYRTVCREIYVANLGANIYNEIIRRTAVTDPYDKSIVSVPLSLLEQRSRFFNIIENLVHYRDDFEGVLKGEYSSYTFYFQELPFKLDICIAATISGTDKRGYCFKYDHQEMNVVNVFPYNDKTIVILGYDKKFENIWIHNLQNILLKAEVSEEIPEKAHYLNTAIIDILLRTDFHCMSTKLYNSLDKELLNCFLEQWHEMRDDYSFDILNRNNLFYNVLKSIL